MNATVRLNPPVSAGPAPARGVAWREVRAILRPWRVHLALVAGAVLVGRAFDLVPPLVISTVVDAHLVPGRPDGLLPLALLALGSIAAAQLASLVAAYLTAIAAQEALNDVRVRLVAHLQHLPLSYYDRTPLGDIISRCTADVETVDTLFSSGVANLVANLVRLLTVLVAMAVLSPPLMAVALLAVPPLLVVTRYFQARVRDAERANRLAVGLLNTHLQETLSGAEVVRTFEREAVFVGRFRRALRAALAAFNRATVYASFYPPVMATLASLSIAVLVWTGVAGAAAAWGVTLGVLTAFVLLFQRFFEPVITLGDDWQTVQAALAGIERITQVLALPAEEAPSAADNKLGAPATIQLVDVAFGYLPERPVVQGVTLAVRPGEQVALVGRTGAGKSSLLHLLGGLYAPWSGRVLVAGRDPRALVPEERRMVVGVVPQTVQLFGGTVLDNLTLGDPAVPRAAAEGAAAIAGADPFIRSLPLGYDTPLRGAGQGEGVELSAGQRQLLALARALVWQPAVLLLDEATAAIDAATEAALRAALRSDDVRGRHAVLTVAHRLSTARAADRVIVLEGGHVVEAGPPEELIERGGRFAALVELEAAGWDWQATM